MSFAQEFRSVRGFLCDIIKEHEDNVDGEGEDNFMGEQGEYEQKLLSEEEEKQKKKEGRGEKGVVAMAHD